MTISKKAATELITKFAEAVRADEMRGSQPPEQHAEIINNYREARSDLSEWFHKVLEERNESADQLSRYSMDAGQADQRMRESRAVRKALGFGEDADDVSPRDLLDAIKKLKREAL